MDLKYKYIAVRTIVFYLVLQCSSILNASSGESDSGNCIHYQANFDRPMFAIDVAYFVDTSKDKWQTAVIVEFVNDLLQFKKKEETFHSRYEMNVAVLDLNGEVIASKSLKQKLTADEFDQTNALDKITRHYFSFKLPSGGYEIFVELVDLNTKHRLKRSSFVVLYPLDFGLAISSLACMDTLYFNGLQPELNSLNIVKKYERPGSRFSGYFEVFSSTEDSVRLDYRIYNQRGETKVSYNEIAYFTDNLVRKLLPLKDYVMLPGKYWLIVEARAAGQKRMIRKSFEIKYWKPSKTLAQREFGDFGVSALEYIAHPKEFKKILLADSSKRVAMVEKFWQLRDLTPDTPENSIREEFRHRVDYTIRNFSNTLYDRAGWDTERGRIFIVYGEPTEIQHRFLPDNPSRYEIWFYKSLDRQFVFLDKKGYGLFRLIHMD